MSSPRPTQLAVATLLFLAASGVEAAQRVPLHGTDLAALNHQYRLATRAAGAATVAAERHAELLGLDEESKLVLVSQRAGDGGSQNYRYQQTFRGVPIWGEQVVVNEGRGQVRHLFG